MAFWSASRNKAALVRDLVGITIGTMIAAFGFAMFLIPFKASPGGVTALSQMLYYLFGVPAGTGMLIFNIPLFVVGVLTLGGLFGFKTIFAIVSIGMYSNLFSSERLARIQSIRPYLYPINPQAMSFTSEPILGVIAGALLLGIGLGIVFKSNGSCGSTDVPALLLRKYFGITVGTGYLLIDTFIILASGMIFKNGNLVLWSMFALFVTSKVTDHMLQGFPLARAVFIVSEKDKEIREMILRDIHRGCTVFHGQGGFTGSDKHIFYTVTNVHELARLKQRVKRIDPEAFITVSEVHEVMGAGFKLLA